ncbi:MAG: 3-dehydroquinate synthase [Planctomycetaceae bacterium]|nr:3-dehydroquinate synthase [Planctomycetaceae bacterium]
MVHVQLGERSYEIMIATDGWNYFPDQARQWLNSRPHFQTQHPRALIVTDTHVQALFGEKLQNALQAAGWIAELEIVPAGEASKSLAQTEHIYNRLVEMQADRKTLVIALGGGVIGDLAGFAAATFMRGLPFLQIPTTLLADVDSSVGGKVGINHPRGKNLIGAFHQPVGVFIETNCLSALPERDFRSGLAEVVKYGVILDAEFFAFLERNIHSLKERDPQILREVIARCCRLKADVVEADEFERSGLRAVLNYGHTFAHAYEALCGYGQLTHGEAVSIGMMDAACLARALGRVDDTFIARQRNLLSALGLPLDLTDTSLQKTAEDYLACMKLDKKTVGGQLRFVLPTRLGHVEMVSDVPEILVKQTLNRVRETP